MLNGIDISNHQAGLNLAPLHSVDFVIAKATEGIGFVDEYCNGFIQQAINLNKLFGFYHFAANNNPTKECDYFISHTKGYQGKGIPVLDWEGWYNPQTGQTYQQSVEWVNEFVRRYHEVTGVWCWIYANPWRFNQGGVEPNCGRWVAAYPNVSYPDFTTLKDADPPETNGLVCAWQFCSDGRINGYNANLDLNYFYGDRTAWLKYANPSNSSTTPNKPEESKVSVLENSEYKVTVERK